MFCLYTSIKPPHQKQFIFESHSQSEVCAALLMLLFYYYYLDKDVHADGFVKARDVTFDTVLFSSNFIITAVDYVSPWEGGDSRRWKHWVASNRRFLNCCTFKCLVGKLLSKKILVRKWNFFYCTAGTLSRDLQEVLGTGWMDGFTASIRAYWRIYEQYVEFWPT